MDITQTAGELIDALGGTSAVAKLCDVSDAAVSQWRSAATGIPRARLMFIKLARPDAFANNSIPTAYHAGRQPPFATDSVDTRPRHCVVQQAISPSTEEKGQP